MGKIRRIKIPLMDLKRQYTSILPEIEAAVCAVLSSGNYIMGMHVHAFEEEFAAYCGVKHAISVANGTDGLLITLNAMNIGPGDEVITSPFTFFATAESISRAGATPVFTDVRRDTFNLDENLIAAAITEHTKAIIPVHLFGQPAAMDGINAVAKAYGLKVIEDACQAAGAVYCGKKVGGIGDAGVFSFFPTKNLSCAGDGGMITTDDDQLAAICRAIRSHGSGEAGLLAYSLITDGFRGQHNSSKDQNSKYHHYIIGCNSRLDEIQAAILRIKLKLLDEYNEKRWQIASFYNQELQGTPYVTPFISGDVPGVYHLYTLQTENRARVVDYLNRQGIASGIYYSLPLHMQMAYSDLKYQPGALPAAEYLSQRTFSIPCFPELTDNEQGYIIETLKEAII